MENTERKVGYVIGFVMDYGNGRQVQITGNLPLEASKEEFDKELDKIRLVTDRQRAYVMRRDQEIKLASEKKMLEMLELEAKAAEETANNELEALEKSPKNLPTIERNQKNTIINQAKSVMAQREAEAQKCRVNIGICEAIIEGTKKDIGDGV